MKTTAQRILIPVAIGAMCTAGCGTSYSPREPGRIAFVLARGGAEVLEKDRKTYRTGGFSGDLIEAVKGNAAAEEHARTYVHQQRVSNTLAIVGGTALVIGYMSLAFLVGPYASTSGGSGPGPGARRTLLITMSSGLVIGVASLIGAGTRMQSAEGHLFDAVNVYNDGASGRQIR